MYGSDVLPFALDKPTVVIANMSRLAGDVGRNQSATKVPTPSRLSSCPLKIGPHGARMSTAVPTAETMLVLGVGRK